MAYNREKAIAYKIQKKEQMRRRFDDLQTGKTPIYYNASRAIIVMDKEYEYYFDSLKKAKEKMHKDYKLGKNYRPVDKETKDDFELDLERFLYFRPRIKEEN